MARGSAFTALGRWLPVHSTMSLAGNMTDRSVRPPLVCAQVGGSIEIVGEYADVDRGFC